MSLKSTIALFAIMLISCLMVHQLWPFLGGSRLECSEALNVQFFPIAPSYRINQKRIDSSVNRLVDSTSNSLSDQIHAIRLSDVIDTHQIQREFTINEVVRSSLCQNGFGYWGVRNDAGSTLELEGERHVDQLVASLAEAGLPSNSTLSVGCKLVDLMEGSRKMATRSQELEWSLTAWMLQGGKAEWQNRFGETLSVNLLIDELLSRRNADCACSGAHKLYTLSLALQYEKQYSTLGRSRRYKIEKELRNASLILSNRQTSYGGWRADWNGVGTRSGIMQGDAILDVLSMTGHHLEWISICPPECRPDDRITAKAVQFFIKSIESLDESELTEYYCGLSHGIRGVSKLSRNSPRNLVSKKQ